MHIMLFWQTASRFPAGEGYHGNAWDLSGIDMGNVELDLAGLVG